MSNRPIPARLMVVTSLAVAAATAAVLTAQQKPNPQTPQTIRSTTDIVSTDLQARDASGRFVPGLTAADFEVYEDGVLQKIVFFSSVIGGRALTDTALSEPEAREGVIMPKRAKPPELGRIFIIFLDDLHIQHSDTQRTKVIMKQIRDTLLHENDLVGIVSSGYSSIAFDLNPDKNRARFNQAIDKFMGSGKTPKEIIQSLQTVEGPTGLRADAFTAFKTAFEILAQAEQVRDRRKAFIYISSGYDFNPFTDSRWKYYQNTFYAAPPATVESGRPVRSSDPLVASADASPRNPFENNGLQFANADLAAALNQLIARARRANTVFYSIDPRGLVAAPDTNAGITQEEWTNYVTNNHSSLDAIANETGGFCMCRTNDVRPYLQRVDNEMSDYYILGYEPSNLDPMWVRRRIVIKSTRPEVKQLVYTDRYELKRR